MQVPSKLICLLYIYFIGAGAAAALTNHRDHMKPGVGIIIGAR
jgi:hypothetical protein